MHYLKKLLILILTTLGLVVPLQTPSLVPQTAFNFAVLSDIHSDLPSLEKALVKIKEEKMDFMVIVGDLTTLGKAEEFKKIKSALDKSGIFYYTLPGNHDLFSSKKFFQDNFGADFQSFQKGKIKFILINNAEETGLDERQSFWLKGELADCPELYCLVFAHLPLNHEALGHIMGEDNPAVASQAARLVRQLVEAQVKELFAGHIHYFSDYELDGLKTTTAGAIYSNKNTTVPRFLEVTVSQPEIKLEKKEVWLE